MLDFSLGELAVVALVALFVVGPKDFPVVMHKLGQWAGKCKRLTDEFRSGFDSVMHAEGLKEVHDDIKGIEEEITYIRDAEGNLQRVYDISDFLDEEERRKVSHKVEGSA